MSLSFLSHISLMHTNFFKEIKYSAQFDANPISILPSVFFLIGSFFILHRLIHRRTHPSTPLHIWIYRVRLSKLLTYYFSKYVAFPGIWFSLDLFLHYKSLVVNVETYTIRCVYFGVENQEFA